MQPSLLGSHDQFEIVLVVQVHKASRCEVQPVAVKVLHEASPVQPARPLMCAASPRAFNAWICQKCAGAQAMRNKVQPVAVQVLHEASPILHSAPHPPGLSIQPTR